MTATPARLPVALRVIEVEPYAPERPAWQDHGACRGAGCRGWFDTEDSTGGWSDIEPRARARATCRRCPVQAECLVYALTNNEQFGIWGGLNVKERRKWRFQFLRQYAK